MAMRGVPHGLILAGGGGRRLGGVDKAGLMLAGRPLLDRVAGRLGPQVAGLALSANGTPGRFAGAGLAVLADADGGGSGPLAGVLAGLDWAAGRGADALVTVPVDTPFLPDRLVMALRMAAVAKGCSLAVAASPDGTGGWRRHWGVALWPVAARGAVAAALAAGERRLGLVMQGFPLAEAGFGSMPYDPFFNLNTPDDMARAGRLVAEFGL